MPKKHFAATRFLDRLAEIEARMKTPPPRMNTPGRQRANNSLAGIDFSNHKNSDAELSARRRTSCEGERRHVSPSGFLHLRIEGLIPGPLEVKKHSIRVVPDKRVVHIDPGMVGCIDTKKTASRRYFAHSSVVADEVIAALKGSAAGAAAYTPQKSHFGKRLCGTSPCRTSLEFDFVPKKVETPPRQVPEPLMLKEKRRCRRYAPDPCTERQGEEHIIPDYGHKALVGPAKHFEPAASRKGNVHTPVDNISVGPVMPLTEPTYPSYPSRTSSPRRGYDVVSLLPDPIVSTSAASPRRSGISGTPLRHCQAKNRSSSPNILSWE